MRPVSSLNTAISLTSTPPPFCHRLSSRPISSHQPNSRSSVSRSSLSSLVRTGSSWMSGGSFDPESLLADADHRRSFKLSKEGRPMGRSHEQVAGPHRLGRHQGSALPPSVIASQLTLRLSFLLIESLDLLSQHCSEFLIHAADVEGLCQGIDEQLVEALGRWVNIPCTYAGGAKGASPTKESFQLAMTDASIGFQRHLGPCPCLETIEREGRPDVWLVRLLSLSLTLALRLTPSF